MNVSGSKSASRDLAIGGVQIPADVTANMDLDLKGWVRTVAGTYDVVNFNGPAIGVSFRW